MPDKGDSDKKKEVLDLVDEQNKPSRRERQRAQAAEQKTVQDKKDEALDIIDEDEQKKAAAVRKTEKSGKKQLPSISKLTDEVQDPDFVVSGEPLEEGEAAEEMEADWSLVRAERAPADLAFANDALSAGPFGRAAWHRLQ